MGHRSLRRICYSSVTACFLGVTLMPVDISAGQGSDSLSAASMTGVQASRCIDFLNSLGANSAISKRGESLEKTIECTRYLGLRWFRSGYESHVPVADQLELHRQTGARFSYGLLSGGTDIPRLLAGARELAEAGALLAVEGNNEPNNWGITYQGQKGGRMDSWLAVARLQRDLYEAVKRDPVLKSYPVWSLTENGAQMDNVGLQFLTIPEGAETLMPAGTRYADYANCHNYISHGSWPGLHDNQTWIAADPGPGCKVDGLYGNYGRTWRKKFPGYPDAELETLPRVTTETGIKLISGKITEEQQGRLFMDFYLAQFKRGWKHTAIYLLRDRSDESGNQQFGFYRPDYTPRRSAVYMHNLTTILADEGSNQPGQLAYSLAGSPSTVHDLLLQKSDGQFVLVVWNERFGSGGSDEVTVTFGDEFKQAAIFDPTRGTEPVKTVPAARAVQLTLSMSPIVIAVSSD